MKLALIGSLATVLILLVSSTEQLSIGTGEQPCFTNIELIDEVTEIKRLPRMRYVSSTVRVPLVHFKQLSSDYLLRAGNLAMYLNGFNNGSRVIPMAGFVTLSFANTKTDGSFDISNQIQADSTAFSILKFGIPKASWEDLPKPSDPSIQVVEEPPAEVASIRFGGYPGVSEIFANRDLLIQKLGNRIGQFDTFALIYAQFDPFWKFWNRRNELYILKKGWQGTIFIHP